MLSLKRRSRALILFVLSLAGTAPSGALAQGFAAIASPPRFELTAKPGQSMRSVLEISNPAVNPAKYSVRSADWFYDDKRNLVFHEDAPLAGSCRPWVAVERREISVPGNGRLRFRFEVQVPADATPQECRFALMIEGSDPLVRQAQNVSFPVSGRLAVIVYVAVGGAQPQLEVVDTNLVQAGSKWVPIVTVRNSGTAHARLAGFLTGSDAAGKNHAISPTAAPILPGDTRDIALQFERDDGKPAIVVYPLSIRGTLEWAGKSTRFEQRYVLPDNGIRQTDDLHPVVPVPKPPLLDVLAPAVR